jgi:hypothetical protein
MEKLAGVRRAPRRRWAVAIGAGTLLSIVGMVLFAVPAFANHVSNMTANCSEVVVSWGDFPSQNTPVHIAIQVGAQSKSADVDVNENTGPTHVDIANLTSQLNGQTGNVVVDVTWTLDNQPHHEHGSFEVTCGNESTSTIASTAPTTAPTTVPETTTTTVPTTVTTGGQGATTTMAPTTTPATESTTTTSIVTSPVTAATGGGTQVSASESTLPFTGGASLPLILIGLALILGGAAAMVAPRFRRHSTES